VVFPIHPRIPSIFSHPTNPAIHTHEIRKEKENPLDPLNANLQKENESPLPPHPTDKHSILPYLNSTPKERKEKESNAIFPHETPDVAGNM
jgi:hypothetical protein